MQYPILMKRFLLFFLLLTPVFIWSQTKAGGIVVDGEGEPVAFANVVFKGSTEGANTNEDGLLYLESSKKYNALTISFIGYKTEELKLARRVNYNLKVVLFQGEQLDEVVVYMGKQSKKNNPAKDILKKICAKKKINWLSILNKYQYYKYLNV